MSNQQQYQFAMLKLEIAFAGLFLALDDVLATATVDVVEDPAISKSVDMVRGKMSTYLQRAPHLRTLFEG